MSQSHRSRSLRQKQLSLGEALIPNKTYFRIGEVSHLTETKSYVLRYWESEFPTLKPVKSRTGHRLYRRQDVETVFEIKRLLYGRGFTIEGARKQLAGHGEGEGNPAPPETGKSHSGAPIDGQVLRSIKRELQAVLTILSGKC